MPRIGLCLSGGGARGAFHIGVLKALETLHIKPTIVSGTSAGALVGAFYCAGLTIDKILDISTTAKWYHFIGGHIPNTGLVELKFLSTLLVENIEYNSFEKLKTPLITTCTNMEDGKLEYYSEGVLFDPILASCAVPIVFKPHKMNGKKYLDGGILMNLPVSILKDKCDFIIASNLIPIYKVQGESLSSYGNILSRVLELSLIKNSETQRQYADAIIEDKTLAEFSRFNLNNATKLYDLGYECARLKLEKLLPELH